MTLSPEEKTAVERIGQERRLKFIILHGSHAKGRERPGSDLDIAILGKERVSVEEFSQVKRELGAVFGNNSEPELDVKSLHGVDYLFRYYVTRDGILLYGDTTEYAEYRAYAFRDFVDSEDLRRLEYRMTRAKQELIGKSYAR